MFIQRHFEKEIFKFREMAFSSSIKKAQAIKLCELCEENSPKWRCVDCDMCLCQKCKTFHLKVPVTAKHQIVTIGTPLQNVQKKIITDNIPCKVHPKKMTCLYCISCDSLICTNCASSDHKQHNFVPIESALDEKLDYLRGIQDKIDANLKFCESKTSEVQDIKSKYHAIFDESLTNIKQREKELKDAIRKHSKHLQETVEKKRSQMANTLSKIEQDVGNTRNKLEDQRGEIDATLTSNQGGIIFRTTMKINDLKFDSFPNQIEQFIPGVKSTQKIQELFGSLQTLSIPTTLSPSKMEFEVIRTFTTDLPVINQVVALDQSSAWISCQKKDILRKLYIKDNNMTTSQELSLTVNSITMFSNDEILLTVFNDSDIKLVKNSDEIVSFLNVAPLLPYGIHVTKDNDVIVGVKEPGDLYTPTDQSTRAVIVYGIDIKQKHKYQNDNEGKRLFTLPLRVTTNNQDMIVVDRTSDYAGRVVVLNKAGDLRWLYEGHHKINANQQFNPVDIVTTTTGHAIVSDGGNDALHVLSENGEVLICRVMRDIRIISPWVLDIDNKGRLWLGCGTCGKETGAKLHIIKLIK